MAYFEWSTGTSTAAAPARAKEKSAPAAGVLVGDLYVLIERDYRINQKKSFRNVKIAWSKHLKPVFANHPAREFDPELVDTYILRRQAVEAKSATINREIAVLKRMASLALEKLKTDDEKLIAALVRWSRIKGLQERNTRKGFVKDAAYDSLARETAKVGLWLRTMFECAYTFGFRKGELLSMKVSQFDVMQHTLALEIGETKNDEPRLIDLSEQPKLYELLRECARGKKPDQLLFTRTKDASGRVSKIGGRIVDFRDTWKTCCDNAGCSGLLFHDLRRTGVSNMIRDGLDEKVAMTISGHKTRSVFDRYHIVRPEALKDAARKMAKGARERHRVAVIQQEFFAETPDNAKPQ